MKILFTSLLSLIIIFSLTCSPTFDRALKKCIASYEKEKHHPDTSRDLPSELHLRLYPDSESFQFPEEKLDGYNNDFAVAVSGGGFRSFSCAIGQLKGLLDCGVLSKASTVSYLSGSSWFSVLFNYAHESIPDSVLLGGAVSMPPESLTYEIVSTLPENFIGSPIPKMSDENILNSICKHAADHSFPSARLFSGIFQDILLKPFDLSDPNKFFTYNNITANEVIALNKDLSQDNFYFMRSNRPFFIDNTTIDKKMELLHKMYQFECTPIYFGTPQIIEHKDGKGNMIYLGGGYCDIIGFNSTTPISVSNNDATVTLPPYTFTLFDMMGNCGAAPGSIFDRFGINNLLPEYNYWSLIKESEYKSNLTSFVDGGDLEDLSLIALLRRGFKNIIVFDNSDSPLGSDSKSCYKGINYNIARLFGHKPKLSPFNLNNQDIQIFNSTQFNALRDGLFKCKAEGDEVPWYIGTYDIIEPNNFGLKKYPNNEKVRILWIYNDMNQKWKEKLPSSIQSLLTSTDEKVYMANFPNYKTVFQNKDQMFQLEPEQINLPANMWYYSLREDSKLGQTVRSFIE